MPRSYAPQFRAMVVDQVRSGRPVAEVAAVLELSEGTVCRWARQDRIDRGELAGIGSADSAGLCRSQAPHRRPSHGQAIQAGAELVVTLADGRTLRSRPPPAAGVQPRLVAA